MDNEMKELLKYRYDRAVETLEVAKELYEKGMLEMQTMCTQKIQQSSPRN